MSKRSSTLLAAACVFALGLMGCGSDSVTAPVDTVAPAAVLDLEVTVGTADVDLVWAESPEADVEGYRVYRSVDGGTSTLVSVETAATFHDGTVQRGPAYQYAVAAVDGAGNESPRVTSVLVRISTTSGGPRGGAGSD